MSNDCPRCRTLEQLNRKLAAMNRRLAAALRSTMTVGASAATSHPQPTHTDNSVIADVTQALVTLGIPAAQARKLAAQHFAPDDTASTLLTKTLKNPRSASIALALSASTDTRQ